MTNVTIKVCLSLLLVLFCSLLGFGLSQAVPQQSANTQLAGAEFCTGCHVLEGEKVAKTPHHTATSRAGGVSCEGCHGPGAAHADAMAEADDEADFEAARQLIFSFNRSPLENSARCLTCHQSTGDAQHFNRSEHQLVGVACQNCHSAHLLDENVAATEEVPLAQAVFFSKERSSDEELRWLRDSLLVKSQPELCYTCHATVKGQFALPVHHRVPEGLMDCTDCHNPHGTRNQPMLLKTNWETCVDCHAEKRGPYVFEHAAVEVEGCASCHAPHGSVNRNLLLRREGRFMCLQCHVDPHAPNVPHGRLGFTTRGDCVRCHVAVHGSNHSPFLLD